MIRSIAFNLFFYSFTITIALVSLPMLIMPRIFMVHLFRVWARAAQWGLKHIAGITIEIRGSERLTPDLLASGVIVASKHQSMLDTIMVNLFLPDPAIVLKKELSYIPLYGWFAVRAGNLVVDREGHSNALRKLLAQARERLAAGRPIFIYPEGTRAKAGEKNEYKPGVAALYNQLGITCLPMALNSGLCWGPREWAKRPGHVVMEFLEPIPPGLNRRAFMARLETEIEAASDKLIEEERARQLAVH